MKPRIKAKLNDRGGLEAVEYIEEEKKPKLPLEVFNDKPVDPEKAWKELMRSCKGYR